MTGAGMAPASEAQLRYLRALCDEAGEPPPDDGLAVWEASRRIKELKARKKHAVAATDAQLQLIRELSDEVGAPWPPSLPFSLVQADAEIKALISRKRNGIFGLAATAGRPS